MARAPEEKTAVRHSYVHEKLSLEAAADKHGVPIGTARRWKATDPADWDKARAVNALSAAGASSVAQLVLADFLTMHQATVESLREAEGVKPLEKAEAMSRLADAFTKTMAAVAKAAPDLGRYAVAVELLQDLATFTREQYPEHLEAVAVILEPFAQSTAAKYG